MFLTVLISRAQTCCPPLLSCLLLSSELVDHCQSSGLLTFCNVGSEHDATDLTWFIWFRSSLTFSSCGSLSALLNPDPALLFLVHRVSFHQRYHWRFQNCYLSKSEISVVVVLLFFPWTVTHGCSKKCHCHDLKLSVNTKRHFKIYDTSTVAFYSLDQLFNLSLSYPLCHFYLRLLGDRQKIRGIKTLECHLK